MIEISHESPIALLEQSREYNDYDYALVHLLDTYPEYKEFFLESKKLGRHILLDNSIFELGTAFDADEFAEKIIEIQPDEYIVPDVLEDSSRTIDQFLQWQKKYNSLPGKKIGVIQGKTLNEVIECYKFMALYADKIAISFDYSLYNYIGNSVSANQNKWEFFMTGRQRLVSILINYGIWCNKPHHLLGASLPREFLYYNQIGNIESVDTSNPIVHGLHNVRYKLEYGLGNKISTKLADLIEAKPTADQYEDIMWNINVFKTFVK